MAKPLTCNDGNCKPRCQRSVECARSYARIYYAERRAAGAPTPQTTRTVECVVCGKKRPRGGNEREFVTCHECRRKAKIKTYKNCSDCGIIIPARKLRFCDECGKKRTAERYDRKNRKRRALKAGRPSERYSLAEVQELSCHVCALCGGLVDPLLPGSNPQGPTVDHIPAIAKGGADLRHNVQLAHRVCNSRKGVM